MSDTNRIDATELDESPEAWLAFFEGALKSSEDEIDDLYEEHLEHMREVHEYLQARRAARQD
jgi:hypothetical protein